MRLSIRSWPRKLELRCFSDSREDRANVDKNARLTPLDRERIVRVASGQTPKAVAEAQASSRGRFASGLIVIAAKDWQVCRIARPGNVLEHSHKPVQTVILSRC
jgi:hypothetical protein